MGESRVETEGLHFGYGSGPAVLRGVDFTAGQGEIVGLLGRNGGGKTTLLRLLASLLQPTGGRLSVASLPAVVFDRSPFQGSLSGAENMRVGAELRRQEDPEQHARQYLGVVGLADDADRPVDEYSLGMRRRLALAEALAAKAALTLLDEPTLGLDPEGEAILADELAASAESGGTTIIATNDATFAANACTRILVLGSGRILADGSPSSLIAALGAPTIIEVDVVGEPPGEELPAGLDRVAATPGGLVLSGDSASARLPELCSWLSATGTSVTAIRVREPGLGDVFHSFTGRSLRSDGQAAL